MNDAIAKAKAEFASKPVAIEVVIYLGIVAAITIVANKLLLELLATLALTVMVVWLIRRKGTWFLSLRLLTLLLDPGIIQSNRPCCPLRTGALLTIGPNRLRS